VESSRLLATQSHAISWALGDARTFHPWKGRASPGHVFSRDGCSSIALRRRMLTTFEKKVRESAARSKDEREKASSAMARPCFALRTRWQRLFLSERSKQLVAPGRSEGAKPGLCVQPMQRKSAGVPNGWLHLRYGVGFRCMPPATNPSACRLPRQGDAQRSQPSQTAHD